MWLVLRAASECRHSNQPPAAVEGVGELTGVCELRQVGNPGGGRKSLAPWRGFFSAGERIGNVGKLIALTRDERTLVYRVFRALVASSTGEVGGAPPMLGSQAPPPSATA
jgi:hypothetical protein